MSKSSLELLNELIAELEMSVGTVATAGVPPVPAAKKEKKEKGPKAPKAPKPADAAPDASAAGTEINVNSLDLRVGRIVSVTKHESAEKLYCEMIDIGEAEPRAIASGLVPYYTLEEMTGRRLIVVANLKPRNLVGFKSNGMVLCASATSADGSTKVEFVDPPANAKPGDRIVGDSLELLPAMSASQCDKKKAFDVVAADLKVDVNGMANWKGMKLVVAGTTDGCSAPTIRDAPIH